MLLLVILYLQKFKFTFQQHYLKQFMITLFFKIWIELLCSLIFNILIQIYKQMQQNQQKITHQEDSIRYKILPLFKTNVNLNLIPLLKIQMIFEALKYSVDYYTIHWTGSYQPIFSYFDLSYFINYGSSLLYESLLIIALVFMNVYWVVQFSMFLLGKNYSNLAVNFRKLLFIFTKNVLFVPLFNIVLNLNNCSYNNPFRTCYSNYNFGVKIGAFFTLAVFTIFISIQTFFNFQFLPMKKDAKRLKHSSLGSLALLGFVCINQMVFYITKDIISILLMLLMVLKDQQRLQKARQIQLSFQAVNLSALLLVNVASFLNQQINLVLFFILTSFIVIGLMQWRTRSLEFELQNINKYPTADIMIRYTENLRYYLSRRDEYLFKVYIHGYMEMHRQKCDNPTCVSRLQFSQAEKRLFETGELLKSEEQLFRCENLIKFIYKQGYKLNPISAELQLQYAIFLYELGEKQLSLKNILLLNYEELSLDKYYCYNVIKEKIHQQMIQEPNHRFLDLVSGLQVKREEQKMIAQLQKAALINLQFWSVLNEDHPDFQKLNQIAASRIQIRKQIKDNYQNICQIAYSEKITRLFVHYLQSIQNDESMYNQIYDYVKQKYQLSRRIVLQDWSNTSNLILLTSIEDSNYGTIIDINTSCASLFGYQRYELVNRPLKLLFTDDLKEGVKQFLLPQQKQGTYFMTHKSGYLLKIQKQSQNYNSMETGMASIITINLQLNPNSCHFIIANNTSKIIGISASTILLLGMQNKIFQNEITTERFFNKGLVQLQAMAQRKDQIYYLKNTINQAFRHHIPDYDTKFFKLSYLQAPRCTCLELHIVNPYDGRRKIRRSISVMSFQFQVQASKQQFKYYGNFNHQQAYLSQFSLMNYAQSLKEKNEALRNYNQGISTLRLRHNIIQVIEEGDDEEVNALQRNNNKVQEQIEEIPRKDQQVIFDSKASYEEFIGNYKFSSSANLIMGLGLVGFLGLYITYYVLFYQHNSSVITLTSEIAYQNLIIGGVTKQLSLIYSLKQMASNQSYYSYQLFRQTYVDNIQYLDSIKLNGSKPYQIEITLGNNTQTFLTDEFLLSFINYAQIFSMNMTANGSITSLASAFEAFDPYKIDYLTINGASAKQIMIQTALKRENDIGNIIKQNQQKQILMLVGGLLFGVVFVLFIFMTVSRINNQKIQIFQMFLDISEIQIQQFTSKTQKFLMSLHVQDTNGQIDVDEEVENTKKINSSTFAKKKRFKMISFNKSIYWRLLIIPFFAVAYFIHSFVLSYVNLNFQANSYHYFFETAAGDYKFYSGLAAIQQAMLNKVTIPTQMGQAYMVYYRDYFNIHYDTFGYINDFHQTFSDVFMLDICNGNPTPYGNTSIPQSCQLPDFYPNGSYLIFTDITMRTQFLQGPSSLAYDYLLGYDILSKTHRLLTLNLLTAQSNLISSTLSSLLTSLIIWILVMIFVAFLYGMPTLVKFLQEINEVKNIISILPLKAVKQMPLAKKYLNKILKSGDCC